MGRGRSEPGPALSGVPTLRGAGSLIPTPTQRSELKSAQARIGGGRPGKERSGDGSIKDGFPEKAALTMGSEELKNDQECVRQDGTAKVCFWQRDQHRPDRRGASFVHFAGRTLNGTLRHSCWWRESTGQRDHFVREDDSGGLRGGGGLMLVFALRPSQGGAGAPSNLPYKPPAPLSLQNAEEAQLLYGLQKAPQALDQVPAQPPPQPGLPTPTDHSE